MKGGFHLFLQLSASRLMPDSSSTKEDAVLPEAESASSSSSSLPSSPSPLVATLQILDPILQFLTKATGFTAIPAPTVVAALPPSYRATSTSKTHVLNDINGLAKLGILRTSEAMETDNDPFSKPQTNQEKSLLCWDDSTCCIGFPLMDSQKRLHGSTKAAAKRRMSALKKLLLLLNASCVVSSVTPSPPPKASKDDASSSCAAATAECEESNPYDHDSGVYDSCRSPDRCCSPNLHDHKEMTTSCDDVSVADEHVARNDLNNLFQFEKEPKDGEDSSKAAVPTTVLPGQVSYAGSNKAQKAIQSELSKDTLDKIPSVLLQALTGNRKLYRHQVLAIEAAMRGEHCSVCTGTGSGKSLCFLLPILTAAYNDNTTSLLLFPTKALAQDQLSKLLGLLQASSDDNSDDLAQRIRPATLDGDTPHAARARISDCNVILTNPDTLHAAVLPSWSTTSYKSVLATLQYIVIDEAHTYDGVFGAHVAMILRRLVRLSGVASAQLKSPVVRPPTFFCASATLPWPERHFRVLCPIANSSTLQILEPEQDGSPRARKHFFVWNPPILNLDGTSTGKVTYPRRLSVNPNAPLNVDDGSETPDSTVVGAPASARTLPTVSQLVPVSIGRHHRHRQHDEYHRRHAAEETARLLARAAAVGVRCIAFCKTRNLVEWVFSKTLEALKANPETAHLASKIESYRGGYSMKERRKIEQRLFCEEIIGVVGTNALELGVDIGGIDLTLHCGYPSSYTSLLQQAGRAGRGTHRLETPSVALVVCFNSPPEQQIWRRPKSLLGKGLVGSNTIPLRGDLVESHILCASEEFCVTGDHPASKIVGSLSTGDMNKFRSDRLLFGTSQYDQALDSLVSLGSVVPEEIVDPYDANSKVITYTARPSYQKTWKRLSIRSIEPINYAVVDVSHPSQGGRMDTIHDQDAVLDTLPYSRVFFHAHPGSIITHRAKRYKIVSMTRPPVFCSDNFGYRTSLSLAAFAKPTNAMYLTRPLSTLTITVVKQMEVVQVSDQLLSCQQLESPQLKERIVTFAGCGAVSVKREVRGYKKLSIVTRVEISRTELSLPPIEYDTFGLYICADPESLSAALGDKFGPGVHALSHALLSVAPMFAHGISRGDLECDHSYLSPTQIVLFDERAGGSGCVERIWSCFFQPEPNNILESAVNLLETCSSCNTDRSFDGGCPACLHSANCLKFNTNLSRCAAITIGRRMLERIKLTEAYKANVLKAESRTASEISAMTQTSDTTPRRKARKRALEKAKDMQSARKRQFVVGRPSWPLDGENVRRVNG